MLLNSTALICTLIAFCVAGIVILCFIKKNSAEHLKRNWILFISAIACFCLGITLSLSPSSVLVIESDLTYQTLDYWGNATIISQDGDTVTFDNMKLFKKYYVNFSEYDIINYAVAYGEDADLFEYEDDDIQDYEAWTYGERNHGTDYYFEEPDEIQYREKRLVSLYKSLTHQDYVVKYVMLTSEQFIELLGDEEDVEITELFSEEE